MFSKVHVTLHCTLTHSLHSEQVTFTADWAVDCLTACLGYSFGFSSTHFAIRHTVLPSSLLTDRLFPSCIRSLSVNIVLRIPLNDVRDPAAAATWHPGGPWGSNRRDNPSQTPSCGKIWNPLPRVTASYFCSSNVVSLRYSCLFCLY